MYKSIFHCFLLGLERCAEVVFSSSLSSEVAVFCQVMYVEQRLQVLVTSRLSSEVAVSCLGYTCRTKVSGSHYKVDDVISHDFVTRFQYEG